MPCLLTMAKRHAHPAHQSQDRILQETEVYLMSIVLYVFISKFGISDKTTTRRAQVDKSIVGPVKTIACAQVPFGWQAEGFVHFLYFFFNVVRWVPSAFKGSTGRTELFLNANPAFGVVFLWCCHLSGIVPTPIAVAMAFVSPFIWIDGLIWLMLFRIATFVFAAGLAYGAWWFFCNA